MRTIVDLPENAVKALDAMGAKLSLSRAELVRRSVNSYLEKQNASISPITNDIYGLYSDLYDKHTDSLELQNTLREEWGEKYPSIDSNFMLHDSGKNGYNE